VRRRAIVLAVVVLVSLLSAASASRGVLASSVGRMFLGMSPEYLTYVEDRGSFGTDELLLLALPIADPLDPASRARLERLESRLLAHPDVGEVHSVLGYERLQRTDGGLLVRPWAEVAEEEPGRTPEFLDELADDPLIGATLVPRDRTHTVVVAGVVSKVDRAAEEGPAIVGALLDIVEEEGFTEGVHKAGWLSTITATLMESAFSLGVLLPLSGALLLIVVWGMFRRLWPAALSMVVAMLAVLWTMGFAVHLDREVNILMAAVPAIVLVVAFSDTVHLCSAYLLELADGHPKEEAILRSAEDVGFACLWTSVTTFAGFVSLSLIPTPLFRHLGVVLGFSVAVALLLAMTVAPVLFSYLPTPRPLREGTTSRIHAALDAGLAWCARTAVARPRTLVALFAAATVVGVGYGLQITIETDFEGRMAADHPVRVDDDWFRAQLTGTTTVDLYVDTEEEGGLLDPEVFGAVAALQARLEADPRVDHALSYVDAVHRIHDVLRPGDGPPTTRRAIAQDLLAFEMGGGSALDALMDVERRRARMTLRLTERGVRTTAAVGHLGRDVSGDLLAGLATVHPSGLTYLIGDWLDEIVTGQRNSVLVSVFLVFLLMSIALGSARVGLLSMFPNLLPLIAIAGWIGFAWDTMDSDTLIVAVMAIGVGVDDTIHFLVRYRLEAARSSSTAEAIERTFHFAGRAIAMTTIILVVGFLPFAASDYFSVDMIGKLLPTALIVALLADLLLVPALVELGPLRLGPATD